MRLAPASRIYLNLTRTYPTPPYSSLTKSTSSIYKHTRARNIDQSFTGRMIFLFESSFLQPIVRQIYLILNLYRRFINLCAYL